MKCLSDVFAMLILFMIASDKRKELFCEAEGVKRSDSFSIFLDIFFSLSGLSNQAATTSEQT